MLLVVCAVVVILAMRELLARVAVQPRCFAVALTFAVLAVLPAQLGRPFDSVVAGLVATALLCAPLALLGARRWLRGALVDARPDIAFAVVFVVLLALGTWVELGACLWDGALGHYGFSSSIARGVLPPEHPLFPGAPLRYHVGFDVLVALVVTGGAPVGAAVHLVSIALLALSCLVLRDAGRALGAAGAAAACVPAVALLGYGPASACLAGGWAAPAFASCSALFPSGWVSAQSMPPSVMSSFFQHPQGLAMPIALALVLIACARLRTAGANARVLVASLGLVLLSQCQIVFFACAGLAIGVVAVGEALLRRSAVDVLVRLLALGGAGALGVLSSLIAGGAGELRFGQGYFQEGAAMRALHHLALFGPTIAAVPLAVARIIHLRRARSTTSNVTRGADRDGGGEGAKDESGVRIALIVAATAGFVVANAFTYARSWDIVKFFAVGSFFANVLLADLLIALAASPRPLRRMLAVAIAALSMAAASFWLLRHGPLNGVVAPFYGLREPSALGRALLAAAGDRIGPRDVVLTARTDIWQLGFHVAGAGRAQAQGQLIDLARADERQRIALRALRSFAAEDLDALSVDWVLTDKELPPERFARDVDVLDQHLYRVLR